MTNVSRRLFLARATRAGLAVAVVGLTGCTDATTVTSGTASTTPPDETDDRDPAAPSSTESSGASESAALAELDWARVSLGFVSAYVLVRNGEAAVVDTGTTGSETDIGRVIADVGLGWSDVGHVILTHRHGDHVGSLGAVMDEAATATAYAGAADIAGISGPRPLVAVGDGDQVMGLDIIETPGHTPGHVSVHDTAARLLVAGDAMNGTNGGVTAANPGFSSDMVAADASVKKMALLDFDTVLFGHGEPVEGDAGEQVRQLADSL